MSIVILGAGFGGLELAASLSEALGENAAVTLIDKADSFVFGFAKFDVLFGDREPEAIRLPYDRIEKPGVTFRRETVTHVDPAARRVTTDQGTYEADVLVVALGADYNLDATPGLQEGASEFYSVEGVSRARNDVASFAGGNVVIAVTTPHFKCPPAPNEAALLMHDFLTRRGLRKNSTVTIVSPMPNPLPVSQAVADSILAALTGRDIQFRGKSQISRFDPSAGLIHIEGGEPVHYDLALAVPVHRPPDVIARSGLGTAGGWVQVEARTLKTSFPDVYGIGDVAAVGVPRAGVFSEGQARVVARQILDTIRGERMSQAYAGAGICYVEMGVRK